MTCVSDPVSRGYLAVTDLSIQYHRPVVWATGYLGGAVSYMYIKHCRTIPRIVYNKTNPFKKRISSAYSALRNGKY